VRKYTRATMRLNLSKETGLVSGSVNMIAIYLVRHLVIHVHCTPYEVVVLQH